jgi:hypothetical protein
MGEPVPPPLPPPPYPVLEDREGEEDTEGEELPPTPSLDTLALPLGSLGVRVVLKDREEVGEVTPVRLPCPLSLLPADCVGEGVKVKDTVMDPPTPPNPGVRVGTQEGLKGGVVEGVREGVSAPLELPDTLPPAPAPALEAEGG